MRPWRGLAAALIGLAVGLLPAGPMAVAQTGTGPAPPGPAGPDDIYTGTDPNRNLQRYQPFRVIEHPRPLDGQFRGIHLTPEAIELVQGGQLVRTVAFDATKPVSFEAVAQAVGDGTWITPVAPGIFGLRAAFVHGKGTNVRFAPPAVTELRLAADPAGVFIGGRGAGTVARFEAVRVTSWDTVKRAPSENITIARPFVLYEDGARLDVVRSEMAYLGSDRVGAYGVSWRIGGATGEVTESVFHHNFFGVYTYEAKDIAFRRNVFRQNVYYGWDPHDFSTGLVAEENEAYGNGSHGFIVSKSVTDSTIRNNYSHDNAGNGVVLDAQSDRNVVSGNRVEDNAGDGIVLLGSSDNVVEDNTVSGNRVGVRANKLGGRNVVRANRVTDNEVGVEAYGGAFTLTLLDNVLAGNTRAGLVLDAPGSVVRGGAVARGTRGIELRAPADVVGVDVRDVDDAVVVGQKGTATLSRLSLRARRTGVRVEPGGSGTLAQSTVHAPKPVRGRLTIGAGNRLIDPTPRSERRSMPWLAVAGLVAVVVAVALEALALTRDRRARRAPSMT